MTVAVSVIVPCYNQAPYVEAALDSVRQQTVGDWECIVVDDGSTDGSADIVRRIAEGDPRFRYVRQDNAGPSAARNRGLDLAAGRFIQFLDGDDLLMPSKFEQQLTLAEGFARPGVVISDFLYMDEQGKAFDHAFCRPRFLESPAVYDLAERWETDLSIPIHSFLFDSTFFRERAIRFDLALRNHEDWDCWIRIFSLDPAVGIVDQPMVVYRKLSVSNSTDSTKNWRGFRDAIDRQYPRFEGDGRMKRVLDFKKALTDYSYGVSLRARMRSRFESAKWLRRHCPWRIWKTVCVLLDAPRPTWRRP